MRALDVHRSGRDREADNISDSYDMCLWTSPLETRSLYLSKPVRGKSSPSAARSDGLHSWHSGSVGSDWQSDPWRSGPSGDPGGDLRSVRSRSGNR